jgi:hypothetical protein
MAPPKRARSAIQQRLALGADRFEYAAHARHQQHALALGQDIGCAIRFDHHVVRLPMRIRQPGLRICRAMARACSASSLRLSPISTITGV